MPASSACALLGAARRVRQAGGEDGQKEPGDPGDEEGRPPAVVVVDEPAQHVPGRRADGDGGREDGEDPAALLDREVVGEEGRRDRAVGRLPHPHRRAGGEERSEAARETAQGRGETPDRHPGGDQPRPRPAVPQGPEDRRGQHVDEDETGREPADLAVRKMERRLQALDDGGDDEAVQVVEQVDEGEDEEPPTGDLRGVLRVCRVLRVRRLDRDCGHAEAPLWLHERALRRVYRRPAPER